MKKNIGLRIALPLGVVVCTAFIFWQSLLSAADSSAQSGRIVGWLVGLLGWEYRPWMSVAVRKAAHFTEFAVLGTQWGGCARVYDRRRLWRWGLLTGAVDECLQFFAPGRAPMVIDVLIDTAGFLCGVALVYGIAYWRRKKIK